MKLILSIVLVYTCSFSHVFSQDTLVTFFDSKWKETTEKNHVYYRKLFKNTLNTWVVQDFYKDGQKQMDGYFNNPKAEEKNGHFVYYHENGQKSSEGEYLQGYKTGYWKGWFPSGAPDNEGGYLKGNRNGIWKWYHENGQLSARETYKNDKLKGFEFFDETGLQLPTKEDQVSQKPEFPGGVDSLLNWLKINLNYPGEARLKGISGIVYVNFKVNKDGSIADLQIDNPVHPLLDNEAIRVVRNLPNWSPGKAHNRFIVVNYTIPIKFTLY